MSAISRFIEGMMVFSIEPTMTGWAAAESLVLGLGVVTVLFLAAVAVSLWTTRKNRLFHGDNEFDQARAYVHELLDPEGSVKVQGEIWYAIARGDHPIAPGERVRVVGRQGMYLLVEPFIASDS